MRIAVSVRTASLEAFASAGWESQEGRREREREREEVTGGTEGGTEESMRRTDDRIGEDNFGSNVEHLTGRRVEAIHASAATPRGFRAQATSPERQESRLGAGGRYGERGRGPWWMTNGQQPEEYHNFSTSPIPPASNPPAPPPSLGAGSSSSVPPRRAMVEVHVSSGNYEAS